MPAHKIYEDDTILAFLDIFPINEGHVLVIPKQHVSDFHKCDTDLYTHMMVVAQKIAQKIQSVYTPSKVALRAEGFEVNHTHIHVMPLYAS
ncbi:HIT family protein [bacterium]|nr:HIT family protein [bacterium]